MARPGVSRRVGLSHSPCAQLPPKGHPRLAETQGMRDASSPTEGRRLQALCQALGEAVRVVPRDPTLPGPGAASDGRRCGHAARTHTRTHNGLNRVRLDTGSGPSSWTVKGTLHWLGIDASPGQGTPPGKVMSDSVCEVHTYRADRVSPRTRTAPRGGHMLGRPAAGLPAVDVSDPRKVFTCRGVDVDSFGCEASEGWMTVITLRVLKGSLREASVPRKANRLGCVERYV